MNINKYGNNNIIWFGAIIITYKIVPHVTLMVPDYKLLYPTHCMLY